MTAFADAAPVRVTAPALSPLDDATLGRLARAGAALVLDQDEDDCVWLPAPLRPLGTHARVCGPAFTVNARPGDNVAVRLAISTAAPGDVLVIAGKGDLRRALVGEIMVSQAAARGIAGLVIEGAVRDAPAIGELPIPVFCLGSALKRATKHGHGELGSPVAIGNEVVFPGDVVCADPEGVVVVRRAAADAVGEKIERALAYEADRLQTAASGQLDLGVTGLARRA